MMEEKTKTANADRYKHYREKNAEEYKIKDVSRKMLSRLKLKADESTYEQYEKRNKKENRSRK